MVSCNCKHAQHVKIYLPCNFEVNLITHLGVIALFSSIFFFHFNTFRLIFQKLFRDRCSVYCKNVQHIKIYLPCNFEVNPITHFDRLCKLEKRGDEIKKKSSPLKLLNQSQPNFAEMILRWSPFKIVSVSAVLYPRWPPLLKIEISSNDQNCSILSQKVPKFELYKHNDELFNIYYGIFYELCTFTEFDRLCKLKKGG